MFFEGIRSERKLIETASLHLAHRWYLGYHLDVPLPDHSSLTRIRQRLGLPIFRRFFLVAAEKRVLPVLKAGMPLESVSRLRLLLAANVSESPTLRD